MPATRSNQEIVKEILALDPAAKTDGLNQPALLALLDDVQKVSTAPVVSNPSPSAPEKAPDSKPKESAEAKAKREGREESARQAEANRLQVEAEKAAKEGTAKYVIAQGKALTSKRDILAEGDAVFPEDFHGKHEDFNRHVASGHIVKK